MSLRCQTAELQTLPLSLSAMGVHDFCIDEVSRRADAPHSGWVRQDANLRWEMIFNQIINQIPPNVTLSAFVRLLGAIIGNNRVGYSVRPTSVVEKTEIDKKRLIRFNNYRHLYR